MSENNATQPCIDNYRISRNDSIQESGRRILSVNFNAIVNNEMGTINGDYDALHDMRVATRRFRVAYDLFDEYFPADVTKEIYKSIKLTGKKLGLVRDLDVFLVKMDLADPGDKGKAASLEVQKDYWVDVRENHRQELLIHFESDEYQEFKLNFSCFLATPKVNMGTDVKIHLIGYIRAAIENKMKVVQSLENVVYCPSFEKLHTLRIAFKELRYTLEFFQGILGNVIEHCIVLLKNIQDYLGDINDARIALEKMKEFRGANAIMFENAGDETTPLLVDLDKLIADKSYVASTIIGAFPEIWEEFAGEAFKKHMEKAMSVVI